MTRVEPSEIFGGGIVDERLDLFRRVGAALRERSHFAGNDREAAPLLTRTSRFNGGVERKDVRLKRDAVDDRDDFNDLLRAAIDVFHHRNDITHDGAAFLGMLLRA